MYELILASQSPRRRQLLIEAGYSFRTDTVKVSENIKENLNPREVIEELSQRKALCYFDTNKHLKSLNKIILCADTMVVFEGKPLGKPKNHRQAFEYLSLLSGRVHSVITAFSLYNCANGELSTYSEETKIEFNTLKDQEIQDYIETGEPMDKAGAYAIQGGAKKFVSHREGSWSNVVGFPIELFNQVIAENGWTFVTTEVE